MAIYQGTKAELMKSKRAYLPNDIIFEFDDSKKNVVRMKTGKLHTFDKYSRLPYVTALCECHDFGKGFVTNIGDGENKEYVVEHDLDSNHILYQIYDNLTGLLIETHVESVDNNNIKVIFNSVADVEQYKVVIYSARYYTDPCIGNEEDLDYEIDHEIGVNDILTSVLNTESNEYEYTQVRNVDANDTTVSISFNQHIKNNQYLVSMDQGNYTQTVSISSTSEKTFLINHNLDCEDILVQIYSLTEKKKIYSYAQIKLIDKDNVEITFLNFDKEYFKDRQRLRIVILDVRDIDGCCFVKEDPFYKIEKQENRKWDGLVYDEKGNVIEDKYENKENQDNTNGE